MLCNTAAYRSVLHSSRLVLYHFQQWVTYRHHDITHYLQKVWKSEINTKWLKYVGMWRGMKWRKMEVDVFAFRMKSQVQLNVKEDQTFCFLLYSPLWTSDLRLRFSKFRKILTLKNCKSNSKFFSEFWNYFILSKFLIFFKIWKKSCLLQPPIQNKNFVSIMLWNHSLFFHIWPLHVCKPQTNLRFC